MQLPGDANATTPGHARVPAAAPRCRQPPGRRAAGHGAAWTRKDPDEEVVGVKRGAHSPGDGWFFHGFLVGS